MQKNYVFLLGKYWNNKSKTRVTIFTQIYTSNTRLVYNVTFHNQLVLLSIFKIKWGSRMSWLSCESSWLPWEKSAVVYVRTPAPCPLQSLSFPCCALLTSFWRSVSSDLFLFGHGGSLLLQEEPSITFSKSFTRFEHIFNVAVTLGFGTEVLTSKLGLFFSTAGALLFRIFSFPTRNSLSKTRSKHGGKSKWASSP